MFCVRIDYQKRKPKADASGRGPSRGRERQHNVFGFGTYITPTRTTRIRITRYWHPAQYFTPWYFVCKLCPRRDRMEKSPGFACEDEASPRCNLFVRDSNENLRERVCPIVQASCFTIFRNVIIKNEISFKIKSLFLFEMKYLLH